VTGDPDAERSATELSRPEGSHAADARSMTEVERLVARVEPPVFRDILHRCLSGNVSPQVTLMQMICESESAVDVRGAVHEVMARAEADSNVGPIVRQRVLELARALSENAGGVDRIVEMLRSNVDTSAPAATVEEGIAFCERLFDWSVQQSEESSVALYSLGSPEVLGRATDEVVDQLARWGTLGTDRVVLQIGCGIGRFEFALASRVREACGIDVSMEMVRAAQRRCAGLANVHITKCSGHDLADFEAERFDLVYAVDTFPYLVQSGPALVERHFAEVRRVLKTSGDFVIFNFSYRGDLDMDRVDVRRVARQHAFDLLDEGVQVLELWDGAGWRMRKR
jgi:cyclopropane fatty-acyl-phospholipid synthase-like methyltransferase